MSSEMITVSVIIVPTPSERQLGAYRSAGTLHLVSETFSTFAKGRGE